MPTRGRRRGEQLPPRKADADALAIFVQNSLRASVQISMDWPNNGVIVRWHRLSVDGTWTRFKCTQAPSISEALRAIINDEAANGAAERALD